MELVKISRLFHITYGNQLDLNKQDVVSTGEGIPFVNRSAENLGVSCKIQKIENLPPFKKGLITVSLGGSILEAFVQLQDFYTGQNIKVLEPKEDMTYRQKIFYCLCIKRNAYRYSAFGREANITFDDLLVPNDVPNWLNEMDLPNEPSKNSYHNITLDLNSKQWKYFTMNDIFTMDRGKEIVSNCAYGETFLISSTSLNNGVNKRISSGEKLFKGNSLTIANNGSVGTCYYQKQNFYATTDVTILRCENLNNYNALFLVNIIKNEKYRFAYGRKWGFNRMKNFEIKLPITKEGCPNWQFMEDYIKSLPYSSNL